MPPVFPAHLISRWLLLLILLASAYFFGDFLIPVLAALIISLASWPLYNRLVACCRNRTVIAASAALVIILLVLVVPIFFAMMYAVKEASNFVAWALLVNKNGVPAPLWISSIPLFGDKIVIYWNLYLGAPYALGELVQILSGEHLGNLYRMAVSATGNLAHLLFNLLFMLITLFFVYKDGKRALIQLDILGERTLPERWQRFSRVVPAMVSATVIGMGIIAIGEGLTLGIAYWIVGVPSPVLLGVITGFMALIPGGAPLAFSLVSLYSIGLGKMAGGIGLFIWGSLELLVVDKTLRPRLVGGPVKLPFLPTIFGLVGGIKTMGLVGLFVGPVLMALLVAVWKEGLRNVDNKV